MSAGALRLPLSLRFAARELRGGLKGFYVFIACIALGVAAISSVGSVSRSLQQGILDQGQAILGGDYAVSLIHRQASDDERAVLEATGTVSEVAFLRGMVRRDDGEAQSLAELKAVDDLYPLFGRFVVAGEGDPHALMQARDGRHGLIAEASLAARLDIEVGDVVRVGEAQFVLAGILRGEPDRLGSGVGWGPRVIMSIDGLRETALLQPGSLVRWAYRVALPAPASDAMLAAAERRVEADTADAGWRVRTRDSASPGLSEQISRFTMFLTLVGLTALVVGGVGVANAVSAYLGSRRETIAIFKSLGANGGLVFRVYLIEMMLLACAAMALGLLLGVMMPWLVGSALAGILPVAEATPGIYPVQIAQSVAYGLLTALAFALWPLGRARQIPATALFREHVGGGGGRPSAIVIVALVAIVLALAGLAVALAHDPRLAVWFVAGTLAAFVVLRLVAFAMMALARRAPRARSLTLRLAVAAIHRPGAVTPSVVLSLGLGLTLLVAVAQVDGNLTRQLTQNLPDQAPSFFFLDLPRERAADFRELVGEEAPAGELREVPMLRGRIVSLAGTPVADLSPPPEAEWVLRGDRGITYSDAAPEGAQVVEGEWWERGYDGPPLVSFDAELAGELGLSLGDEVTVNVLGREITATLANTRTVDWQSLSINFVMVFSPNTFAGAPHMVLATVTMPQTATEADEIDLMRSVTAAFPTVTSVRVKEALQTVDSLVRRLAWAVRAASGFTLVAGILVLGGALAASHRHRIHDAVVLKTLGATRSRLVGAYALEFALIGVMTAAFALATGTLAAWLVVEQVMNLDFTFLPVVALAALVAALALTVGLGLAGTWRVLGRKPAAYLRDL